jgi:hypothetical protein
MLTGTENDVDITHNGMPPLGKIVSKGSGILECISQRLVLRKHDRLRTGNNKDRKRADRAGDRIKGE